MKSTTVITLLSLLLASKATAVALGAHEQHLPHRAMHAKREGNLQLRQLEEKRDVPLVTEVIISTKIEFTTTIIFYSNGQSVSGQGGTTSLETGAIHTSFITGTAPGNVQAAEVPAVTSFTTTTNAMPITTAGGASSGGASEKLAVGNPGGDSSQQKNTLIPAPNSVTTTTSSVATVGASAAGGGGVAVAIVPTSYTVSCSGGWGKTSGPYGFTDPPAACGQPVQQCTAESPCSGPLSVFDEIEEGMYCGYVKVSKDQILVALPYSILPANMGNSNVELSGPEQPINPNCNRAVSIEIFGKSTTAYVVDRCPSCGGGLGLDLSPGAYSALDLPSPYTAAPPIGTFTFL